MALVVLDGQVLLHLACHVAAEVQIAQVSAGCGERQDYGRRELVVRASAPFDGLEDVDRVPDTLGAATGCGGCLNKYVSVIELRE